MNIEDSYPRHKPQPSKHSWVAASGLMILFAFMLVAAWVPTVRSDHGSAKVAQAKSDIATLCSAIDVFRLDCGRYPTSKEGFQALQQAPAGVSEWRGPYVKGKIPQDPWGNPYLYSRKGKGYQVKSYAADGQPGGDGDNADIIGGSDS